MSADLLRELDAEAAYADLMAHAAKHWMTEAQKAARDNLATIMALVQAAGGKIEISRHDLLDMKDMELLKHVNLDRDCLVYRVRRKAPDGQS